MLTLSITDFMIELKDGSIKNVGAPSKSGEVKLFDVTLAEARSFGDNRVKLEFGDGEGNSVEIALFPEEISDLLADIEQLDAESGVFD